jgi:sodium-independent sulfate anion transporter 11
LIAGLTVGLTVIPQGLAYANLANLPAQYGLYSSFMGVFVYCLLGTSKDITLGKHFNAFLFLLRSFSGPTAIMSMLVAQFCSRPDSWPTEYPAAISQSDPALAVNLTMLTGLILVILGVLNLGFIVNFISHAVIVGFVSAASILISFSQGINICKYYTLTGC